MILVLIGQLPLTGLADHLVPKIQSVDEWLIFLRVDANQLYFLNGLVGVLTDLLRHNELLQVALAVMAYLLVVHRCVACFLDHLGAVGTYVPFSPLGNLVLSVLTSSAVSQDEPHTSIICLMMAEHRIHLLGDLLILHGYYNKT